MSGSTQGHKVDLDWKEHSPCCETCADLGKGYQPLRVNIGEIIGICTKLGLTSLVTRAEPANAIRRS